jgi:hypothetical protein
LLLLRISRNWCGVAVTDAKLRVSARRGLDEITDAMFVVAKTEKVFGTSRSGHVRVKG